jgi:hypothetical protein
MLATLRVRKGLPLGRATNFPTDAVHVLAVRRATMGLSHDRGHGSLPCCGDDLCTYNSRWRQ